MAPAHKKENKIKKKQVKKKGEIWVILGQFYFSLYTVHLTFRDGHTFGLFELVKTKSLTEPPSKRDKRWSQRGQNQWLSYHHMISYWMASKDAEIRHFKWKLTWLTVRQITWVDLTLVRHSCTRAIQFTLCPDSPTRTMKNNINVHMIAIEKHK